MSKFLAMLQGKKAYVGALAWIIGGGYGYLNGDMSLTGFLTDYAWVGFMIIAGRSALTKLQLSKTP